MTQAQTRVRRTRVETRQIAPDTWRTRYRHNPAPLLIAAAAGGFLLGAMGRADDDTVSARPLLEGRTSLQGVAERMLDAFVAAASIRVAEYVEQFVPGFHEEFSRRG